MILVLFSHYSLDIADVKIKNFEDVPSKKGNQYSTNTI